METGEKRKRYEDKKALHATSQIVETIKGAPDDSA